MSETIEIPRPHVPFGPHGVPEMLADAEYLDHAARNIEGGYPVGGYNVTAAVVKLLHDTANAIRREQTGCVWRFDDGTTMRMPHEPTSHGVCENCARTVAITDGSESTGGDQDA